MSPNAARTLRGTKKVWHAAQVAAPVIALRMSSTSAALVTDTTARSTARYRGWKARIGGETGLPKLHPVNIRLLADVGDREPPRACSTWNVP